MLLFNCCCDDEPELILSLFIAIFAIVGIGGTYFPSKKKEKKRTKNT